MAKPDKRKKNRDTQDTSQAGSQDRKSELKGLLEADFGGGDGLGQFGDLMSGADNMRVADQFTDRLLGGQSRNKIDGILSRGPKPSEAQLQELQKKDELAQAIEPTEDEKRRAGELLNAYVGEFVPAIRTYAFAKRIGEDGEMQELTQQFMENPNLELEDHELERFGWKPFAQLLRDLSIPVLNYHQALEEAGVKIDEMPEQDIPAATRIAEKKILPLVEKYHEELGLYDLGSTEAQRREDLLSEIPGFALVVRAMMHDPETRGLYAAIKKDVSGELLDDADRKLLADNEELVGTIKAVLRGAGLGYATAPCNQVYRVSMDATDNWNAFMREANLATHDRSNGSDFKAATHDEKAMEAHKKALESYRLAREGLGPVCKYIEQHVDTVGETKIDEAALDKITDLLKSLPKVHEDPRITYNSKRVVDTLKTVFKKKGPEMDFAENYVTRSARVNSYASTTDMQLDDMTAKIETLRAALKESGGTIKVSDERFRDVYMGLRGLAGRMEMMRTAAEQLHNDMGRITGSQNKEWVALETEMEREQFSREMPDKPSSQLKNLAERIQRSCTSQRDVADGKYKEVLEAAESLGEMDKLDIIHDYFSRLTGMLGEQISSMEARQAKWDKAHPGTGGPGAAASK